MYVLLMTGVLQMLSSSGKWLGPPLVVPWHCPNGPGRLATAPSDAKLLPRLLLQPWPSMPGSTGLADSKWVVCIEVFPRRQADHVLICPSAP